VWLKSVTSHAFKDIDKWHSRPQQGVFWLHCISGFVNLCQNIPISFSLYLYRSLLSTCHFISLWMWVCLSFYLCLFVSMYVFKYFYFVSPISQYFYLFQFFYLCHYLSLSFFLFFLIFLCLSLSLTLSFFLPSLSLSLYHNPYL